ncbi:unnamed protein product [Soboliphyme baturini]|uniref:CEPT1 n=1 Tax=Soboliphyme baturini TaxID=241478 RepID=A0A183J3F0_9BILA|nr:unnamed protein product [Soboliphyme baturini]
MNVLKSIGSVFSKEAMLSQVQLKRLSEHKYNAQDYSLCDEVVMNKFWDWVVSLYPLWLAPNLITVIGIVLNIAAISLLCCYSPDSKEKVSAPCWMFLLCAVSLFVHQTLDATDGKQARRTGCSSPLGELLDHGCDSVSQTFVSLQICISMQLGDYPGIAVTVCWACVILFYCAHWQTYVSGVLKFGRYKSCIFLTLLCS